MLFASTVTSSWMALGMNLLDGAHIYVDVAHCCLDVGVAHQRLHTARVRPVLNQGGTERVAQLVRMNVATQNSAAQLLDNQERRLSTTRRMSCSSPGSSKPCRKDSMRGL